MIASLVEMFHPSTFLRDTFFRNTILSNTEFIDIDIEKGKRRVAVYVRPVQEGHIVETDGFSTKAYKAPYIKEKMQTVAGSLLKRTTGEMVYSTRTPLQRAQEKLNKELIELDEMHTRAEEIQCMQAMTTGIVTCKNEDGVAIDAVDFGLDATHKLTLTGGALWNDSGFKKNALLAQLRTWRKVIVKDSGINPDHLILGSDALDQFLAVLDPDSATVGNSASSIRVDRGVIDPAFVPGTPGVIYWGYIKEVDLYVYSYDEYYLDGSTVTPLWPAKKVWMGSVNARFDRCYAVIQDMDALYAVPRFPKQWREQDPSVDWLMLQSAPLMCPHQVDSFLCAQVLT